MRNELPQVGFFENVWKVVLQIPRGKVASYGQIAALLGSPRAARTVGWAMNSTPDELDIPWHRVINSRGRISLNENEQGGNLQRLLLEQEGVKFNIKGFVDLDRYQWVPTKDELKTINVFVD
jgi:methylated-DNA-protein-cysteine methyltransferase related protein